MNPKSLRRLAADHAQLHASLPPNYLFAPSHSSDDLTTLSILLAGPDGTPYATGIFTLVLNIPATYPTAPPTACFKTRIWHPNVEEATGKVCVETLKRDWDASLRLYDVLVTISCLLIQPNSASALNAEAGMALERGWAVFERRAKMMTGIHAPVPRELVEAVREAKGKGEEDGAKGEGDAGEERARRKGKGKGRVAVAAVACAVVDVDDGSGAENAQSRNEKSSARTESSRAMAEPLSQAAENVLGISGISTTNAATVEPNASMLSTEPQERAPRKEMPQPVPAAEPSIATTSIPTEPKTPIKPPPPQSALLTPSSEPLSEPLYLSWYKGLMVEKTPERLARQKAEHRRLKAAGWDLKLYNRGVVGGVREKRGLKRL